MANEAAKKTAAPAEADLSFGDAPEVKEAPTMARGPQKDVTPQEKALMERVWAAADGRGKFADGHLDGILIDGAVGRDGNGKLTLTGSVKRAAAVVNRAIVARKLNRRLRYLAPGDHTVAGQKVSIPDGKVGFYFLVGDEAYMASRS